MPRLFPFAHPRHRQHQAIFPPYAPSPHGDWGWAEQVQQAISHGRKTNRVGARSLGNQPESVPKKSEAQPIGVCHYAVQHSLSMPLGSTSMSSDSSLKKSRCKMREMFATTSVSKLLFATNRYTTDRLRPNCLANQPTDRPCRSSSALMSCPMCIMLAYVIDMMA